MLAGMKRLECLDGLRGLLAVYVLLGHLAPFAALPGWVQAAASHGGAAVDVFFMLSGLVITQSLLNAGGRAKPFLIARAMRIFPVYLPVFALAVIVQPLPCGFADMPWIGSDGAAHFICAPIWPKNWPAQIVAHLSMTHGLLPNAILPDAWVSLLGAAWSLSTEWQFYVLALLVAGRRPGVGQPALCWMLLALAVAGIGWQAVASEDWRFSRAFLPNKAHLFALGVASLPVVCREPKALPRYAVVLVASLLICATQDAVGKLLPPLAWTVCLWVQMNPHRGILGLAGGVFRCRPVQYLGAVSYCLYLVNEPIHKIIAPALGRIAAGDSIAFSLLWLPLATGLPIVAASWLHTHLEAPALRWRRGQTARPEVPEATQINIAESVQAGPRGL